MARPGALVVPADLADQLADLDGLGDDSIHAVSAFSIGADGSLGDYRPFCEVEAVPDGIALDADGSLWIGDYRGGRFIRVGPTPGPGGRHDTSVDGVDRGSPTVQEPSPGNPKLRLENTVSKSVARVFGCALVQMTFNSHWPCLGIAKTA